MCVSVTMIHIDVIISIDMEILIVPLVPLGNGSCTNSLPTDDQTTKLPLLAILLRFF